MKKAHLVFMLVFTIACSSNKMKNIDDQAFFYQLNDLSTEAFKESYLTLRTRIQQQRSNFHRQFQQQTSAKVYPKVKSFLEQTICDSLIHFWYTTEWNFYGTTETPREGNIACGYFVTTVLSHSGFRVNRVKLAQQAASIIINTVCEPTSITIFSNGNLKGLRQHFSKMKAGLYIIGLDNHVGFIQKRDSTTYMIHASGSSPYQVVIEKTDECRPILLSKFFMIGNLLDNEAILKQWINNEKIVMID